MNAPTSHPVPLLVALIGALSLAPSPAQLAVLGDTVHTMAGEPIEHGVVLIGADGKIVGVGSQAELTIPAGTRILTAAIVTPGLIDAHSSAGLAGILNQKQDKDELDRSGPIQPELRALDAYNVREPLVVWLREHGVTTLHTGHAPRALVSGRSVIVKTRGNSVEEALVAEGMYTATLGDSGMGEKDKSPGTRSKAAAMLREELIKAREYLVKLERAEQAEREAGRRRVDGGGEDEGDDPKGPEHPPRDLRLEALGSILNREVPLLVSAHRSTDIATALRLAREFGFDLVISGGAEAYLLVDEIVAAAVPVIVHPTMFRAHGETENLSMETAAVLRHAGITIALQSSYESYVPRTRVILFEAAIAVANGLTIEEGLASMTRDAAAILGIADRVGTLESGKDGDLVMFDGDPFEYTTHVTGVVIEGKIVSAERR